MKKILPAILITLIFANIFAPISVNNKGHVSIQKVQAEDSIPVNVTNGVFDYCVNGKIELCINAQVISNDVSAKMLFYIVSDADLLQSTSLKVTVKGPEGEAVSFPDSKGANTPIITKSKSTEANGSTKGYNSYFTNLLIATNLKPDTSYDVTFSVVKSSTSLIGVMLSPMTMGATGNPTFDATGDKFSFKTQPTGSNTYGSTTSSVKGTSEPDMVPACSIAPTWLGGGSGTFVGCIAQVIYYVVFTPTSYLFALAGKFFDFAFFYSVSDASYKASFVVQGWGIVRDLCNMFFIFVLLYVAFATILNIHGFKTKEMVINVVIIGVLMNFSLFATQVIIDTSNILARVFYSSNTIKVTQTSGNPANGASTLNKLGPNGEIQLSAALVDKVDPQNLILNAQKVNDMSSTGNSTSASDSNTDNIGVGTFILVTLLASAVNIVGLLTFLSVGLIFVARVIGLWFAMILVPLAFFSYTVPALQDVKMIGWKKWWPETLKLAFLAPIFIFFLYLILKFLEPGLSIVDASNLSGVEWVVAVIIPFAFIMVLLMKAKDIAKDFSGEMGQSITGAISAAGGMALGGAALGAAAIGRKTIGSFMSGASTGDTAARRLAAGDPSLSRFGRVKGRLQQISGVDWAQRRVGARLNANQHDIEHATHARHDLDTAANTVAPGKKWSELNGNQRLTARTNLERIVEMRNQNLGHRTWAQLSDVERDNVTNAINPRLANNTTAADQTIQDARRKQGPVETFVQSTVGGSFDARNLSKVVAGEQDAAATKIISGLTSAFGHSMRGAFKQTNVHYGTGQKEFVRDLGHTITEALKSTSVKVDLSHVGEEKKEGDHGGGHH